MKRLMNLVLIGLFLFGSVSVLKAQDPEIERLQLVVNTMIEVKALPVEFKKESPELTPVGLANVRKQAALLKRLPAGAVIEVGGHVFISLDPFGIDNLQADLDLSQKRAERVREELIKLGIKAESLTAVGYGRKKLVAENLAANGKAPSEKIEYSLIKSGLATQTSTPKPTNAQNQSPAAAEPPIIPGKGFGKIVLGATVKEVNAILGRPEEFIDLSAEWGYAEAIYYSRGIKVELDSKTKTVIGVSLIGDGSGTSFEKYKTFRGKTDKGISWGATLSEVKAAYGKPLSEHNSYKQGKSEVEYIRYPSVEFGFRGDKLYYIANATAYAK